MAKIGPIRCSHNKATRPQCCPFCRWKILWKHGNYFRKGFHTPDWKNPPAQERVERYLCRSPKCGKSFGVLPEGVLPYCRFFIPWLYHLWELFIREEKKPYRLWKACPLPNVSLGVIKTLIVYLNKLEVFVKDRLRERDQNLNSSPWILCRHLIETLGWERFSTYLYHGFYPLRQ